MSRISFPKVIISHKNLHYNKDDILFKELERFYQTNELIMISSNKANKIIESENLSEEEKDEKL